MEMKFNFKNNSMQDEALRLKGKNIYLNAPTGSGKTEAILLNLKEGSTYHYFLPTITSCIFMYKRLKALKIANVIIKTSRLKETTIVDDSSVDIIISTPDPYMIQYLYDKIDEKESKRLNLILDELDGYPVMVQSVLLQYIKEFQNRIHLIVASATISSELAKVIKSLCHEIKFSWKKDMITHKARLMRNWVEIVDIVNKNPSKKIGFILNSIANIERCKSELQYYGVNIDNSVVIHHSRVDDDEFLENEERLFNSDFRIFISNDIIGKSVDVNFDILFTECTDKLEDMIQRMGRCNRQNKTVHYQNLGIIWDLPTPPFIDEYEAKMLQEFTLGISWKDKITVYTHNKIKKIKESIEEKELPSIDYIVDIYWNELHRLGIDKNLREVPLTFREHFEKEVKEINKKKDENGKVRVTIDMVKKPTSRLIKLRRDTDFKARYCYDKSSGKNVIIIRDEGYIDAGNYDNVINIRKIEKNDKFIIRCATCYTIDNEKIFDGNYMKSIINYKEENEHECDECRKKREDEEDFY